MTAATRELVPPKHILVNGRRIRLRWLQQIIWSFVAANVGALIITALYYLFVELRWHVGGQRPVYQARLGQPVQLSLGWAADRHDIRNVYEALLATLFVKSLLANWRKHDRRAPAWYVAALARPDSDLAFPIVAAGILLINYGLPYVWHALFAHHAAHNPAHLPYRVAWLGTYRLAFRGSPW